MNLYEITNGYMATNYVHVLIISESQQEALKKASEVLEIESYLKDYPDDYYNELEIELLCEDVSKGYISKIRGG